MEQVQIKDIIVNTYGSEKLIKWKNNIHQDLKILNNLVKLQDINVEIKKALSNIIKNQDEIESEIDDEIRLLLELQNEN